MATTPTNSCLENDATPVGIPDGDKDSVVDQPTSGNISEDRGFSEQNPIKKAAFKEYEMLNWSSLVAPEQVKAFAERDGNMVEFTPCTLYDKTWSPCRIAADGNLAHLLEECQLPLTIGVRSFSPRGLRSVVRKITRSTNKNPTVEDLLLLCYSEEEEQVNLGNQEDVSPLGKSLISRLKTDWNKFSPIWNMNWNIHFHMSRGRFPDGGSDQSLRSKVLSTCLEETTLEETTFESDEVVVEEEIVISGKAEIQLNRPPEPMSYVLRLDTYGMFPNFSNLMYFMVEPLALCGFILLRENVIKCADRRCSREHSVAEVLGKMSKEVNWHTDGCIFATARRPCMNCIPPTTQGRECDKCGQFPRGERTFHHRVGTPEENNSA